MAVSFENMSLKELKKLEDIIGTIVVFDDLIGTSLRIISDLEEEYGIMGVSIESELGKKLISKKIGEAFCPHSGIPTIQKEARVRNFLTIEDIKEMLLQKDDLKASSVINDNDIVLGDNLKLYRVRGNSINYVSGLTYGATECINKMPTDTVSLGGEKVKILGAITDKTFRNRLR